MTTRLDERYSVKLAILCFMVSLPFAGVVIWILMEGV